MEETREEMGLNREEMEETGKKGKKLYSMGTLTIIMQYCYVYGPLFAFFNVDISMYGHNKSIRSFISYL